MRPAQEDLTHVQAHQVLSKPPEAFQHRCDAPARNVLEKHVHDVLALRLRSAILRKPATTQTRPTTCKHKTQPKWSPADAKQYETKLCPKLET